MKDKIIRALRAVPVEFGGEPPSGWLPEGAATPASTPVTKLLLDFEVVELDTGSYLLQWKPSNPGSCAGPPYEGDTWHATIEEALHQAELSFGVPPQQWPPLNS